MRAWGKRYGALLLVLLIVSAVCLLFAVRKSGMFIDEIYTYGLSNSHYAPFLKDVTGGSMQDRILTRQQMLSYLAVDRGQGFDALSVYFNQTRDVHPPLYYWLLNAVCSLTPGVFSKWSGLALDWVIYLWCVSALYLLILRLFDSPFTAAAGAALYGLSFLGLSTMLMVRMYVLMTALTVQLALVVLELLLAPGRRLYPLLGLTVFLGLMTQYYFVFYAFFLCGFAVLELLRRREFARAGRFALWAMGGALLLPLCFPACLRQLSADALVSGGSAVENLLGGVDAGERIGTMNRLLRLKGLRAARFVCYPALALLLVFVKRLPAALRSERAKLGHGLLLLLPALIVYPLVAVMSPVPSERYFYNILPILMLIPCTLLHLLERCLGDGRKALPLRALGAAAVLALALWEARYLPPDYLYPEHRDYSALLRSQGQSTDCVYLTDGYYAPVTQDLLQLMEFDEVFLTGDPRSPALARYAGGGERCVAFIDTSAYWSSGFVPDEVLPELCETLGLARWEELYSYELSSAYLLTK